MPDLVLQVLTPLVEEIYWTPQMLEGIKSQLRMMRDVIASKTLDAYVRR